MGYPKDPKSARRKPVIIGEFSENTRFPRVYRCFRNLLDCVLTCDIQHGD
jgi:hypothetical protein